MEKEIINANYSYDPSADVLYVFMENNKDYESAINLNGDVILSFNSKGIPIAFYWMRLKYYMLINLI